MKIFNKQILTSFLMLLILFPISVSAIDFFWEEENEEVIFEVNQNVYLKYVEQDKSDYGKNDHPVELNEEEIRKSLELLTILGDDRYDSEEDSVSVFTPLQISLLSKYLLIGLTKANPGQDIIFALKKDENALLGLKKDQFFMAGRVFYKDGKLNILIGDYDLKRQKGYEAVYDPTHMGIVKYRFDHGYRLKKSIGFKEVTAEVEGIENKQVKGTQRRGWFVIDLSVASKAFDTQLRTREKSELAGKRRELREILGEDAIGGTSARERAQNSKERREMRAEMARMRKEMGEMSGGKSSGSQSLEERLVTLDRLKKKGLISDKEYQIKRQAILNDI